MRLDGLDLLIPCLEPRRPCGEAALLGMAAWLWMRSPVHRRTPLYALQGLLLPALKHDQFILGRANGMPVFFCSWAWLDADAEARYLASPKDLLDEDWRSGDRLWFIDWVAPFGHTRPVSRFLRAGLFAQQTGRFLSHKPGRPGGDRIRNVRGICAPAMPPCPPL
jgi:cytolysin-activating lysine-acyltransferase